MSAVRVDPFQSNLDWFLPRLTEAAERDAFSQETSLYLFLVGTFQQGQKSGAYFHETAEKVKTFLQVAQPTMTAYDALKKFGYLRDKWRASVLENSLYSAGLVTELTEEMDRLVPQTEKMVTWFILSTVREAVETHVESVAGGEFGDVWQVVEDFREGYGDPDDIHIYEAGVQVAEEILTRYDTFARH